MNRDWTDKIGKDTPLHSGETEMARRYPNPVYRWDAGNIGQMIRTRVPPSLGAYLADLPFFFIATSNENGHCDASYRGREYSASGPCPLVLVQSPERLVFPDFRGNGLYQSLGNILQNPHIGMLFMDFEQQARFRVNGKAETQDATAEIQEIWPGAQAYVSVSIEQVFGNCQARIPRMTLHRESVDPFN